MDIRGFVAMIFRTIPALFHWRPPHDPDTFTGDTQYRKERMNQDDRRRLKKRTRRILDRMDQED